MTDDSLERFSRAVERVRDNPSMLHAQEAVQAARVAWAMIYTMLLLAGGFRRDKLDAFAGMIDDCAGALRAVEGETHIQSYVKQMIWYHHLLDRLREHGIGAVNIAIDEAFESREKCVGLDAPPRQ